MTDRAHTLTVVLEKDMRVDDLEEIVKVLHHIKGVSHVGINVSNLAEFMAIETAKAQLRAELLHLLIPSMGKLNKS